MQGRELLIGVTGGIAAYKTAYLVSRLVQQQARVTVVMTPAACRFVGTATFAALTGRPVATEVFAEASHPLGPHIELAEKAELMCVAPATADVLARLALGLADDLLTTLALSIRCPLLVAPAMNSHMWAKPAVQRHIATLRADGVTVIDPEAGWLSCRQTGPGRMAEPDAIFEAIRTLLDRQSSAPNPASTQPASGRPSSDHPAAGQPASGQSAQDHPAAAHPAAGQPAARHSAGVEPASVHQSAMPPPSTQPTSPPQSQKARAT